MNALKVLFKIKCFVMKAIQLYIKSSLISLSKLFKMKITQKVHVIASFGC